MLKVNSHESAHREAEWTGSLIDYIRSHIAVTELQVSRPIAVVDIDDQNSVFVMQHNKGRELGAFVLNYINQTSDYPLDLYRKAVKCLAVFHAWSWQQGRGKFSNTRSPALKRVAQKIVTDLGTLGVDQAICSRLGVMLDRLLPDPEVVLAKKDAHPENWLVESNGNLTLLDIEATALIPIYYEFVQMIDDYPFCPVDEFGMQMRIELAKYYTQQLREMIPEFDFEKQDQELWRTIQGYLPLRVAFGLIRFAKRANMQRDTSSSALKTSHIRVEHYYAILKWLHDSSTTRDVIECMDLMLSAFTTKGFDRLRYLS